jgi:zinc transport system substrate-binding protein
MIPVLTDVLAFADMRAPALLLLVLALAGCGMRGGEETAAGDTTVVAAFYPLAWATESVAGDEVEVVNLTPAGSEPHDLELTPASVEELRDAELVVYVGGGFQPAVEDAVAERDGPSLDLLAGGPDPHVWLDPVLFAAAVEEITEELGTPGAANGARDLEELDRDYRVGLETCERRTLVTSHAAFGRLAARYGLEQLSLTGSSPEAEPSPRELERLIENVRRSGATTVFAEPLVSDRVAETVAREAGARVAVLDPIEGLSDERLEAGEDYVSVMRRNLEALREALGCR